MSLSPYDNITARQQYENQLAQLYQGGLSNAYASRRAANPPRSYDQTQEIDRSSELLLLLEE